MKFLFGSFAEKVHFYIQLETHFILWILLIAGYIFYRLFLKSIVPRRHESLRHRFAWTGGVLLFAALLSSLYWFVFEGAIDPVIAKIGNTVAFVALIFMSVAVIRLAQIVVYLYLFFKNMSQGIPRLIANLFTVVFSIIVICFIASEIFAINLTAMLATSAVFSLVLGLALQDTLGNLFSGVAIQIGQPFKLGDWIEVNTESKKWVGQIQEITWRATFISGFSDEWIMIPNKTIAQSQIIIFSNDNKPLRHSQAFRIEYDADVELIKKTMVDAIRGIPDVLQEPSPRVLMTETADSWITIKIFYSTRDYAIRYRTGDLVIQNILQAFKAQKIRVATSKIQYSQQPEI